MQRKKRLSVATALSQNVLLSSTAPRPSPRVSNKRRYLHSDFLSDPKVLTCCQSSIGNCINLGTLAATVANVIAANIIAAWKINDCSAHTGSVDNVFWKVYTTGAHCETTAQLGTIDRAIRKYFRSQNYQICGVRCIKLDHSGDYNGYVTLAPAGQNPSDYYCGSAYTFGNCGKGGEKD